jgi:glycosyltransferase involved in cell wall biosynthesis
MQAMKRMKIAVATHFPADPGVPHGGVEAVSVNLVRALAALADIELHVVTLDPAISQATQQAWEGATIHRLPRDMGSELLNAVGSGRRKISEFLNRLAPDLVHAHDTYGLMVKGLRIPRVFTIHGFIYGDTLVSGIKFPWLRSQVWRVIETSGWADQPHIISISPYVRERLAGIARGVIHDIDNPISEEFFNIPKQERADVVFSAAAICPRKNTLRLVEAVAMLAQEGRHVELRLAGSVTEPEYGALVNQAVRDYRLEDKVIFLGQIGTGQVLKELSEAAVFALVSLEENSPMGIEEAMAASIPVVTSNRCGMPYMVRDGESGFLVDPNDPAAIARRVGQVLGDNELRREMGRKSRDIALDRFHPRHVAARTRAVYRDMVLENIKPGGGSAG